MNRLRRRRERLEDIGHPPRGRGEGQANRNGRDGRKGARTRQ